MPVLSQFFAVYGYIAVPLAEIEHFKKGSFVRRNRIPSDRQIFDTPPFEPGGGAAVIWIPPTGNYKTAEAISLK